MALAIGKILMSIYRNHAVSKAKVKTMPFAKSVDTLLFIEKVRSLLPSTGGTSDYLKGLFLLRIAWFFFIE